MHIRPEAINLHHIIKDTISVLSVFQEIKNIKIYNNIQPDTLVLFDKNSLFAILRNLLDNAIKYTPNKGEIIISERYLDDNSIILEIKDNGIGIPQEKIYTLFELQQDKSTQGTKGEKGTGLGLHLVHELIILNQAEIHVESELNKGTSFSFSLPIVK